MDPNQTSSNLVSRNGHDISEVKGDPGHTSEPKNRKNDESVDTEVDSMIEDTEDYVRFAPLFKALEEKDWKGVENFVDNHPRALTSGFKVYYRDTIFHLFSRNLNVPISLLKNMVSRVKPELFESELTDERGQSPLFAAALFGNQKAAEIFVDKNKDLPNKRSDIGFLPIHVAAKCGHKGIIQYLLKTTSVNLDDDKGLYLLQRLLESGHYDIVHDLLEKYPKFAQEMKDRKIILEMLASRPLAFESGSRLGFWRGLIYKCIPVHLKHVPHPEIVARDIENDIERSKETNKFIEFGALCQKLYIMMLEKVPGIKSLYKQKQKHKKTLEIVRMMCHDVTWTHNAAIEFLWMPLRSATILGIDEFVNEIMKAYYYSYSFRNRDGGNKADRNNGDSDKADRNNGDSDKADRNKGNRNKGDHNKGVLNKRVRDKDDRNKGVLNKRDRDKDDRNKGDCNNYYSKGDCNKGDHNEDDEYGILHLAILHRQEKVFNLIRKRKIFFWTWKAAHKSDAADSILHLAAKYVPSSQVPGAALQMQRELQWFKAVESFVHPSLQHHQNDENRTAKEVFTKEHRKMVEQGEKWMKDNASSCSVVAAFIVTITFAAAFTVPGGTNTEGIPTFLHKSPFIVYVISDALGLFFSTVSVLMFLGILTSRYAEEDFLVSLPRKLMIGLVTLFISIASMMTAFGAVLYLEISDLWSGVHIPIAVLVGLTLMVFAGLQFPLLVEIALSTYWPTIYQSEE